MYKIIRLRLTLSVGHSATQKTKCLQSAGRGGKNPKATTTTNKPRGRARHTFPFCVCAPQGVTETLFTPKGTKFHLFYSKSLSQNCIHAALNIWEEICKGSYLNIEVRPQLPCRIHIMEVFLLSKTSHIPNHPLNDFWPFQHPPVLQ